MKNLNQLYIKIAVGILLILSISFNFKQSSNSRIAEQNIISLTETLKTTKNKLEETVKSKELLIMNIKELKESNSSLTQEINKLSAKDKKHLIDISKLNITIDMLMDSILVLQPDGTIVVNDTTTNYYFSKINKFRELKWDVTVIKSNPNKVTSTITADKIFADIVIGKTEEDGKLSIFASSSNPYVNITNIEGSVIDLNAYNKLQKKKPFGVGLHIGGGLSTNNGVVFLSPYVGVGLSYNLFNF